MNSIFNFFGSFFGYLLWFFFDLFGSYTWGIFLSVLIITLLMLPFSIKRHKSASSQAKLVLKQNEIRKKCGKDFKKYNEEIAKLYEKENINPLAGCLPMLLPLLLFGGVFGAISKPLENVLHFNSEKTKQMTQILAETPDFSSKLTKGYEQLQFVMYFPELQNKLTMLSPEEIAKLSEYSLGFNFYGLNLFEIPKNVPTSAMLWIIPAMAMLTSILSIYFLQKSNSESFQHQKGFSRLLLYLPNIFFGYITFTLPAAIGVYLVFNSTLNIIQTLLLNIFFNKFAINAREEAKQIILLERRESKNGNLEQSTEKK